MYVTKKQLARLIREACGDMSPAPIDSQAADLGVAEDAILPVPEETSSPEQPCPYSTAETLKAAGMSDAEVLQWINTLLSSFLSEGEFSFTGSVEELPGEDAFGIGYEAGSRGL